MGIRRSDFAFRGHSQVYATRDVRLIANLCFHPNHPKIGRAVQSMANLIGRFIQLFNRNYVIGLVRQDAISYIDTLKSQRTGSWAKQANPELIVPLRIGAEGSSFSSPRARAFETHPDFLFYVSQAIFNSLKTFGNRRSFGLGFA